MFTLDVAFKQAGLQVERKIYRVQFKQLRQTFLLIFLVTQRLCLDLFQMQMIARGKNASDLFPAVVKNVACKNIEVGISSESRRLSPDAFVCFFCSLGRFKVYDD